MEKENKPNLIKLFLYFLKIGLFTIGGGYAMIAMIEKELVDKHHWITHEDMLNIIVIGESTPGPIAVNLATFIGYKMHGFWGSFLCTLGFVLPSFAIITIISVCLQFIQDVPLWVAWFFKGLRAGVVILIGSACVKFFKRMDKNFFAFLMLFMGFFVTFFTDISVIYLILIGGALGLLYSYVVSKKTGKNSVKTASESKFTGRNSEISDNKSKNQQTDSTTNIDNKTDITQNFDSKNSENNDKETCCQNADDISENNSEKTRENSVDNIDNNCCDISLGKEDKL